MWSSCVCLWQRKRSCSSALPHCRRKLKNNIGNANESSHTHTHTHTHSGAHNCVYFGPCGQSGYLALGGNSKVTLILLFPDKIQLTGNCVTDEWVKIERVMCMLEFLHKMSWHTCVEKSSYSQAMNYFNKVLSTLLRQHVKAEEQHYRTTQVCLITQQQCPILRSNTSTLKTNTEVMFRLKSSIL